MSDIVERLRGEHWWLNVSNEEILREMGDLRATVNRLMEHLKVKNAEIERLNRLIPVVDEEGQKEIYEAIAPYRKFINETPELLSLLYDIDLLPEQIRLPQNANRMIAVCELYKRSTKPPPGSDQSVLRQAGTGEER